MDISTKINSLIFDTKFLAQIKKDYINSLMQIYIQRTSINLDVYKNGTSTVKMAKLSKIAKKAEMHEARVFQLEQKIKSNSSAICALRSIKSRQSKKSAEFVLEKYLC